MNRNVDNVEIKEPPIQELNNNRSCLRRSCMTGCLFLFLLIFVFLFVVKFAATPRVRKLKNIPDIVPESVPIYDESNIESISYIAARERTRTVELAAVVPKAILLPILVNTEQYLPQEVKQLLGDTGDAQGLDRYIQLIQKPIFPSTDLIEVTWIELTAQPDFLKEFYEKELQRAGFTVVQIVSDKAVEEIRFTDDSGNITGVFYTEDKTPDNRGTDKAVLNIEIYTDN